MATAAVFVIFMGIMSFITIGFIKLMDLILTIIEKIKNRK